jgi:glutathione S-transferase
MDYVVGTLHMQGVKLMGRRLFIPSNPADEVAMKARGSEIFQQGMRHMDRTVAGKEYVAGPFSVADAALLFAEYWAAGPLNTGLPPNCAAHYGRMLERPAVKRAMQQEGLQPFAQEPK